MVKKTKLLLLKPLRNLRFIEAGNLIFLMVKKKNLADSPNT